MVCEQDDRGKTKILQLLVSLKSSNRKSFQVYQTIYQARFGA